MVMLFSVLHSAYSQNVGINVTGSDPNPKALLDVDAAGMSTKGGLLIPRMNTTERDALSAATGATTESLLIYNTTTQCFEAWNQTTLGWVAFGCLNCQLPGTFNATSATTAGCSDFTANWSVSGGATSYYLDVSTNSSFSSFVAGFANLLVTTGVSYLVTGLVANTTYYYRVRAVNTCGTSINSSTITQATCTLPLSVGCFTGQVEADYGTVVSSLSGESKTWITRNLGATAIATSATSTANAQAGCYFQFNRSQAYGRDNTGTVNPAWTISSISESSDWTAGNDPCTIQLGGAWRIPTKTEWVSADANGLWNGYADAYASALMLHAAGNLFTTGALFNRGVNGYYWSSTQNTVTAGEKYWFNINNSFVSVGNKATGFSLRCLK